MDVVNSNLDKYTMNADQLRMARAALRWSVRDLAEKSGITANTISRIENGSDTRTSTVESLKRALEAGGVVFIPENGGGAGVRLAKTALDAP
jgi:transcriptional regulator with XRE-family HTH domain